jgi:hypothetical protein
LIRANQTSQRWYAGQRNFANHPQFLTVLEDGTSSALATLSSNGLTGFAVNDDASLIYLAGNPGVTNSNVRQWNVGGAAFGADLVAAVANGSGLNASELIGDAAHVVFQHLVTLRFGGANGSGINHIINGTGGAVNQSSVGAYQ